MGAGSFGLSRADSGILFPDGSFWVASGVLSGLVSGMVDLFAHNCCGVCGGVGGALCEACIEEFERPDEPFRLFDSSSALDRVVFPFLYTGRAAHAVRRLKYSRVACLGKELGALLVREMPHLPMGGYDIVVPVPIHPSRERQRGFNQSELMCLAFDQAIVSRGLVRMKKTPPQARLDHEVRLDNLRGAFSANSAVKGQRVLLIDDVSTSGGTALACAEALVASGARSVQMAVLCG